MKASGKTIILVTGANSGIGYDTAYMLAAASSENHVIMACRSSVKGQTALSELEARKPAGSLSLLQLDVTDDTSIAAASKAIEAEFGVLDVLVSNAGVYLDSNTRNGCQDTFNANTIGPLVLAESLVHLLQRSSNPRIIHVTSALGSISMRLDREKASSSYRLDAKSYRMSKAALNMLAACQHVEFQEWGCKVWAYCPGYVISNLGGELQREAKIKNGAPPSETSAKGILEIVEGHRDGDAGTFVNSTGGSYPW